MDELSKKIIEMQDWFTYMSYNNRFMLILKFKDMDETLKNVVTNIDKLEDVKDELEKSWKVQDFYLENFLYELLVAMSAPKEILAKLPSNLHSQLYLQKICEYIKAFGIERYKQFLDTYNQLLEQKQQDVTLPTPSEIISDPFKSIKNR